MYLSLLSKNEKELFLNLAYEFSLIDGDYGIEEQQMIESYCNEMQISSTNLKQSNSLSSVTDVIAQESSIRNKKIIIFEIIGLAMSDGKYDDKEKDYIYELIQKFMLNDNLSLQCEEVISEYISLQHKINSLVIG
ncbi:hypothetical protein [Anaerotignum sp.]|uniref:hypothetical protein n=1 Tax=Anaerotignum sp. TaxID=2039241 RepID=UPI0028979744|nr:hypothetical protein [Anaerotignum sp.]